MREKSDGDNFQRDGGHEEGKREWRLECREEAEPEGISLLWAKLGQETSGHFLYRLAFEHDDKYDVNPFVIETAIRAATGVTPKEMFS